MIIDSVLKFNVSYGQFDKSLIKQNSKIVLGAASQVLNLRLYVWKVN